MSFLMDSHMKVEKILNGIKTVLRRRRVAILFRDRQFNSYMGVEFRYSQYS